MALTLLILKLTSYRAITSQRVGNRWREAAPKRLWFLCIATYVHETGASCPMKIQQLIHRPRTQTCSIVLLVYTFSWTSAYYGSNSYFSTSAVKDDRIRACKPTGNDKKAILQSSRWHSLPTSPSCPLWPSTPSTPTYLRECSCRALGSDSHASPKVFAKPGAQRGTYILGMPLRYGTPLIICLSVYTGRSPRAFSPSRWPSRLSITLASYLVCIETNTAAEVASPDLRTPCWQPYSPPHYSLSSWPLHRPRLPKI